LIVVLGLLLVVGVGVCVMPGVGLPIVKAEGEETLTVAEGDLDDPTVVADGRVQPGENDDGDGGTLVDGSPARDVVTPEAVGQPLPPHAGEARTIQANRIPDQDSTLLPPDGNPLGQPAPAQPPEPFTQVAAAAGRSDRTPDHQIPAPIADRGGDGEATSTGKDWTGEGGAAAPGPATDAPLRDEVIEGFREFAKVEIPAERAEPVLAAALASMRPLQPLVDKAAEDAASAQLGAPGTHAAAAARHGSKSLPDLQQLVGYLTVVGALSPEFIGAADLPTRAAQLTAAATEQMTTAAMFLSWNDQEQAAALASTATESFSQAAEIVAQAQNRPTTQHSPDSAVRWAGIHARTQATWALPELVLAADATAMIANNRTARNRADEAAALLPEPLRRDLLKAFRCPGC